MQLLWDKFKAPILMAMLGSFALLSLPAAAQSIYESEGQVILENDQVALQYNLDTGYYNIVDVNSDERYIAEAAVRLNEFRSSDNNRTHSWTSSQDPLAPISAEWLTITSEAADAPTIIFQAAFLPESNAFAMRAGLKNTGEAPFQLHRIAPVDAGNGFMERDYQEAFQMLDGRGGGVNTDVIVSEYLCSLNNALVTFGQGEARRSLVLGGLTYDDYEKIVEIGEYVTRKEQILGRDAAHPEDLLYLNLGEEVYSENRHGEGLTLETGEGFRFTAPIPEVYTRIAFDPEELVVRAEGLDPDKTYEIGFTWFDANPTREQNIVVDGGDDGTEIVLAEALPLPAMVTRGRPEEFKYYPEAALYEDGELRLRIQHAEGPNAILSEVWLREVEERQTFQRGDIALETGQAPEELTLHLFAEDKVGRRVDPGGAYLPMDYFYLDVMTANPFAALEQYAWAVRDAQDIQISMYDFPTVCLWYAQHHAFGGGPAVNDSPGAVEEMERIKDSGFLQYSTAAVRLVPDNYGVNNQQGWWSDERFQMHGSGINPHNIVVEGGHYKEPYETTRKWGSEVRYLGGLPLLYVQTGVVSLDFAQQYPEWMLQLGDMSEDPEGYTHPGTTERRVDYTHPEFLAHYAEVFDNFRSGNIAGLMYDYPNTGWHEEGGFYDAYSTTARAYRNIYAWAKKGLGPNSYVHERDLNRGTDVSRGVTDSERIWGDTDQITPAMVRRAALRWYKNRVVINYDLDSKNIVRAYEAGGQDALESLLTMGYVISGRFLMGNSFGRLTPDMVHTLSRVFPYHQTPKSARPIDAFQQDIPQIYLYSVHDDWHQLTLYNSEDQTQEFSVPMAGAQVEGALGLDAGARYYAYDFWNDTLAGVYAASEDLEQTLRPKEARMLSLRRVKPHPQVLSTDRHLMQGYLELSNVQWNPATKTLSGIADLIADEPMHIIIADNGLVASAANADGMEAIASLATNEADQSDGLTRLACQAPESGPVHWTVQFSE